MSDKYSLYSSDGRRQIIATSKDEYDQLKSEGYSNTKPDDVPTANSGAEGQRRARASSTTEGSERNSGSTVEDPKSDSKTTSTK